MLALHIQISSLFPFPVLSFFLFTAPHTPIQPFCSCTPTVLGPPSPVKQQSRNCIEKRQLPCSWPNWLCISPFSIWRGRQIQVKVSTSGVLSNRNSKLHYGGCASAIDPSISCKKPKSITYANPASEDPDQLFQSLDSRVLHIHSNWWPTVTSYWWIQKLSQHCLEWSRLLYTFLGSNLELILTIITIILLSNTLQSTDITHTKPQGPRLWSKENYNC